MSMTQKIIIWDNHGTIVGLKDAYSSSKVILPNVEKVMKQEGIFNIICSGTKVPTRDFQNFDVDRGHILTKFKTLMRNLPISVAVFSPIADGTECWMIIKHENNHFSVHEMHEDTRYHHLRGTFKKPDTGMITVIKDFLRENHRESNDRNTLFIGDTWQDMHAAHNAQLPFLHAYHMHHMQKDVQEYERKAIHWRHGQELIAAWQNFFDTSQWQELIKGYSPIDSTYGIVYELPNFLNRINEAITIVDMRSVAFAEPRYHSGLEVHFVLEGEALIVVGERRYAVKKGDAVLIPAFEGHYTVPNAQCVIGCINTPACTAKDYILLKKSNAEVDFDYACFEKDIAMKQVVEQ